MWPGLYANLALLEKSPNYPDKRNAQSVLQDHRPQLVHMHARPALLEVTLPLQDPRVNYVQRTRTRMSLEQKFALFAHQGLHHLVHQRAYTYSVCTYICSRMNTPASASLIRTTIERVIVSFYGSGILFKECSARINRILLLLFLLLFLLLSVYMCVPNELILLHLFVESVSNGSPRLCPGRVALREYRLQDNSEYLHVAISWRR
jgi:hypothetical protein